MSEKKTQLNNLKTLGESIFYEANAYQFRSYVDFQLYAGKKEDYFNQLAVLPGFDLSNLLKVFTPILREKIYWELQNWVIRRNKTAICNHDWHEFVDVGIKVCRNCTAEEKTNGK